MNKIISLKKSLGPVALLSVLLVLGLPKNAGATSFILSDFNGTVSLSAGTQVTSVNELMFGFFANGFTPTVGNFAQWLPNFTGVSGYFDGSSPEWSAGIEIGDNALYPVGSQLSVIVYNILNINEANKASATQAAIITNPSWVITSASGTDLVPNYFDLAGSFKGYDTNSGAELARLTGTSSAVVGILSGSSVQMALIPEPSSLSLLVMGLASVMALRKRGLAKQEKRY